MKQFGWIIKFALVVGAIVLVFALLEKLLPDISSLFSKAVGKGTEAASQAGFQSVQEGAGAIFTGYAKAVEKNGPGLLPTVQWVDDFLRDLGLVPQTTGANTSASYASDPIAGVTPEG
jgi:hypothetical protein